MDRARGHLAHLPREGGGVSHGLPAWWGRGLGSRSQYTWSRSRSRDSAEGMKECAFPQGLWRRVQHSAPSRCCRPGRHGMTGMPGGSVAGTARPCLPSPSQNWEVLLQVGDHLSHFWLGHDLGKAMESSIHKEFRSGSEAWLVPLVNQHWSSLVNQH